MSFSLKLTFCLVFVVIASGRISISDFPTHSLQLISFNSFIYYIHILLYNVIILLFFVYMFIESEAREGGVVRLCPRLCFVDESACVNNFCICKEEHVGSLRACCDNCVGSLCYCPPKCDCSQSKVLINTFIASQSHLSQIVNWVLGIWCCIEINSLIIIFIEMLDWYK